MTDSDLQAEFQELPYRCVCLFEDIDNAGLYERTRYRLRIAAMSTLKNVTCKLKKTPYKTTKTHGMHRIMRKAKTGPSQ
jgi:hypothetical protein